MDNDQLLSKIQNLLFQMEGRMNDRFTAMDVELASLKFDALISAELMEVRARLDKLERLAI